ncbi:MAG: class I SAM-dependent methyltransferase [Alphaproteobacteria bacterium]|nr:class I SAM-dependent methyltransferase [Alphaproteobacteria bacterium]
MPDTTPSCRFCHNVLRHPVLDLGEQPFSNSYLEPGQERREKRFPLRVWLCANCLLVQTDFDAPADEIFSADYAYFSSVSTSWVEHAKRYAHQMIARLGLGPKSFVVEIASNDGYLLQHFVAQGIPVLGIEPTRGTAEAAIAKGINTRIDFFGEKLAIAQKAESGGADLIAANNVLAHVPDIADFTRGFAALLKPEGVATFEFPHVQRLIEGLQFDTIYHEHFSYLSLHAVETIFAAAGLRVFDVEEVPTHGGSLRVFAARKSSAHSETARVAQMREQERRAGLDVPDGYAALKIRVGAVREQFLSFLATARREGKTVAAYGAAAKGNTFLNYCGVTARDLAFVADASAAKQGKLLPGSHVPIVSPSELLARKPGYIVILPWNIKDEIARSMAPVREWGGKFVISIPDLQIF